jgi:hypothetical protein
MSKATELVSIYRELMEALGEDPGIPIEVLGSWASTIFINQNNSAKPSTSEVLEVTGELQLKGKPKQLDNGKTQYSIKVDDQYYNCLSLEPFKNRRFEVGQAVTVKYKQNGKYRNLIEVLLADSENEPAEIPF